MKDIERRIRQILHDAAHRLNYLHKLYDEFKTKVNGVMQKGLLDAQELEDLKSMKKKMEDLK